MFGSILFLSLLNFLSPLSLPFYEALSQYFHTRCSIFLPVNGIFIWADSQPAFPQRERKSREPRRRRRRRQRERWRWILFYFHFRNCGSSSCPKSRYSCCVYVAWPPSVPLTKAKVTCTRLRTASAVNTMSEYTGCHDSYQDSFTYRR